VETDTAGAEEAATEGVTTGVMTTAAPVVPELGLSTGVKGRIDTHLAPVDRQAAVVRFGTHISGDNVYQPLGITRKPANILAILEFMGLKTHTVRGVVYKTHKIADIPQVRNFWRWFSRRCTAARVSAAVVTAKT